MTKSMDVVKNEPSLSLYDIEGPAPDLKVGDTVTTVITGKITSVGSSAGCAAGDGCKQDKEVTHQVSMTRLSCKFIKGTKSDAELSAMDMDEYAKERNKK